MKRLRAFLFYLLPSGWQQKVRNKYYENKISTVNTDEESDLKLVGQLVKEGQTAVDIGANFGLYTKFLSQFTGKTGRVISFEPIHRTFLSLRHNITTLKLQNVEVFQFALSDAENTVKMEIPDYTAGGENLYEARIINESKGKNIEMVRTKILDHLLSGRKIDFIKIDVEGHELNVLKGALKTLETNKPVLLVEINGGIRGNNENARSITGLLSTFGYKAHRYIQGNLVEIQNDDDGFNYFFLTDLHKENFRKETAAS